LDKKKKPIAALLPLASRVVRLRLERRLSQDRLAEGAGISTNHLQNIEAARVNPGATVLLGLAEALGVTVGDLFDAPTHTDGQRLLTPIDADELTSTLKALTTVVERLVSGESAHVPQRAPRRPRR
jgi:transcriptional regulator with XRE-family HTH domain